MHKNFHSPTLSQKKDGWGLVKATAFSLSIQKIKMALKNGTSERMPGASTYFEKKLNRGRKPKQSKIPWDKPSIVPEMADNEKSYQWLEKAGLKDNTEAYSSKKTNTPDQNKNKPYQIEFKMRIASVQSLLRVSETI